MKRDLELLLAKTLELNEAVSSIIGPEEQEQDFWISLHHILAKAPSAIYSALELEKEHAEEASKHNIEAGITTGFKIVCSCLKMNRIEGLRKEHDSETLTATQVETLKGVLTLAWDIMKAYFDSNESAKTLEELNKLHEEVLAGLNSALSPRAQTGLCGGR